MPQRIEWLIVLLAVFMLFGGNVFLLRGSWGGWVLLAVSALLAVMLALVIRQRRRGSR